MRHALITLFGLGLALAAQPAQAVGKPPVIVELFTSQGCSSCPPADAFLADLAQRTDVLPLAFHVDYWDYIGWKDTLGDPAFTARQRHYSAAFKNRGVYTPQMIINGLSEGVGSRRGEINAKINAAQKTGLPVTLTRAGDILTVASDKDTKLDKAAALILIRYTPSENVTIKRGENSGRTISYKNIVRDIIPLGKWDGTATTYTLPPLGADAYVALLQSANPGPVLGALIVKTP
tara:strand:+ start:62 stop:763 length:702 start_codon:yes stop_codon:yes gene_type:complete